uniref:VanZ family protein n=1 Tax=Paenibacillus oryzisoli TaxID=1850517 RepID=UPI003D2CC501
MLSFAIPITLIYFIIRLCLIKRYRIIWKREILQISFILYISALVFIVWIYNLIHTDYLLYNIIPVKTIIGYINDFPSSTAIKNIFGNLAICLPFGFYYYFNVRILPKFNIVIQSLMIPLIIELIQLLIYIFNLGMRTVDIDDIILNSFGILIGYYITRVVFKRYCKI